MAAYHLSEKGDADLADIFAYSVATFGLAVARDYFLGLHDTFALLGRNPMLGSAAEHVRPGLRRFVHRSHVIFYRVGPPGVRIARILHGAQDPLRHLPED